MNDVEDGLQYVIEQGWVDSEKALFMEQATVDMLF